VSVIMPCHNSEKTIELAIRSVLLQTFSDFELLVIDDDSTDNTTDVVQRFIDEDPRVNLIRLDGHHGAGLARNEGIKAAKGKYIAFLDSDDAWLPKKLEESLAFLKENECPIMYTAYYVMDKDNFVVGEYRPKAKVTFNDLLVTNWIGCSTVVYDVEKLGKLYFSNVKHEDYLLWLDVVRKTKVIKGLPRALTIWRTGTGVSSKKKESAKWRWDIYTKQLGLNWLKAGYYFVLYAFNGFRKYSSFKAQSAITAWDVIREADVRA